MAGRATLYAIPNSHPCWTAEKALQIKGLPYRRIDLAPIYHRVPQRLRFDRATVPGLRLADGEKVAGSREIVHRLDELRPEPALFPADRDLRAEVEEAEEWGDEVLQSEVRRIEVGALARSSPNVILPTATGTRALGLPVPDFWIRLSARPGARLSAAYYRANERTLRKDLANLRGDLDRVDGWITAGLIGGDQPNAADLQLAPSLRILLAMGDVRPLLEGRPAQGLAERLVPSWKASIPAGTLPTGWLSSS